MRVYRTCYKPSDIKKINFNLTKEEFAELLRRAYSLNAKNLSEYLRYALGFKNMLTARQQKGEQYEYEQKGNESRNGR